MNSKTEVVASEEPQRRGDVETCPVCGSRVSGEAYHCPTCHNYFCFHCRARLLDVDAQMQCANQRCDYYGKLICAVCDPAVEHEEPPSVYAEPEDGYWPAWLLLVLTVSAVIWWFTSFLAAAAIAVAAYAGGGYVLHRAGVNLFGRQRKVEYKRKSTFHTCIKCQRQVKALRGEDAS